MMVKHWYCLGKFLPGMVSCSDVEVVLPPRVVLRFLRGVAPATGRFSHSHGTEAFARMALRKSGSEDLLQSTRPWHLFFKVLCRLFFFCFLSCWSEEQCMVLAAWDGEMLPVAAWGLDGHKWSWLRELNGFYLLVSISPRLDDYGPGFWIPVAAVLQLLTLCNRLRLCLVVSHPLQCKCWWARERLGVVALICFDGFIGKGGYLPSSIATGQANIGSAAGFTQSGRVWTRG